LRKFVQSFKSVAIYTDFYLQCFSRRTKEEIGSHVVTIKRNKFKKSCIH